MSIQAEKLLGRLRSETEDVEVVPTNPELPGFFRWAKNIPGLRTFIREIFYVGKLLKAVRRADVVHHMAASGISFYLGTVPVSLICRMYRKRLLLNYRGGKAAEFLAKHGLIAIPLIRMAELLVVPSEFLKDVFSRHGFKAEILPNLADSEMLNFRSRNEISPRLICTRHLEPLYNPECVVRAFAKVQAIYPDAALGMVGSGSQRAYLEELVSKLGLKNVEFYGFVPPEKIGAIYNDYDIFVNASLADNFPGSLVEAACCGLPIVSSKAGGIPYMLRDGETALLTDLNSDQQIAAGVTRLVSDARMAGAMASAARKWAEQYSWSSVYPKLSRFYQAERVELSVSSVLSKDLTDVSR